MKRWGCFGLTLGGLIGLLLAVLFFVWLRLSAVSPVIPLVLVEASDATLFLSENSLSHFATNNLERATLIDLKPNGQMQVATRVRWGSLRPVVQLGLTLEMANGTVVSRLHWVQMAFVRIPASWLPRNIEEMGAIPGETITRQVPPGFQLAGFNTTPDGLEFYLNWVGTP